MSKTTEKTIVEKPADPKPKPQQPKKSESLGEKAQSPGLKQPNLFGGEDEVYNVLQLQLTRVNGEIKTVDASIETKKKSRANLIAERDRIHAAIKIMEKAHRVAVGTEPKK